jgi:hypothetical protein
MPILLQAFSGYATRRRIFMVGGEEVVDSLIFGGSAHSTLRWRKICKNSLKT